MENQSQISLNEKKYFNHFDEIGALGSGAFGSVFKAKCLQTEKYFAIKKIALDINEEEVRVYKELKLLEKLDSKYIIKMHSYWFEDNYYSDNQMMAPSNSNSSSGNISSGNKIYDRHNTHLLHIQTDLCLTTLKNVIKHFKQTQIDEKTGQLTMTAYFIAGYLFEEILNGVNYLHECNPPVIHRDLKPENILITDSSSDSLIKICDFGLATEHEWEKQSHTESVGSAHYRAPEVLQSRVYTTKADMFSLGRILCELFNFDINTELTHTDRLKQYYSALYDIYENLTTTRKNKRWSCVEVLNIRDRFILSIDNLKLSDEWQDIAQRSTNETLNDSENVDKYFTYYFLKRINAFEY